MRALRYFTAEAAASLWRGRRAALLAILTIAAGLFVLGLFLVVNANLQRLTARWSESAELVIYLRDDATPEQVAHLESLVRDTGLATAYEHVTKARAAERFSRDFPDLSATAGRLERNPFPASLDVRLRPGQRGAEAATDAFAAALGGQPGVSDVRYDSQWLARLNRIIVFVRTIGIVIVVMLALAAALTVANVVRLAAHARRNEIEIMQLVGAPFTYIRGPLVVEGVMQGGAGALLAIVGLAVTVAVARVQYGEAVAELLAPGTMAFVPAELAAVLLLGGMLLGCAGGLIVARGVR
jgi:cell division transport system permease protein